MAQSGFSHIGLPIEYTAKLPFRISDNLVLDKAGKRQIKKIKDFLDGLSGIESFEQIFESNITVQIEDSESDIPIHTIQNIPLSKENWKYSVVNFKSQSDTFNSWEIPSLEIYDLKLASLVVENDLFILFTFFDKLKIFGGDTLEAISHLQLLGSEDKHYIWTKSDLVQLKKIYFYVRNARINFPDIHHSLKLFLELPRITGYNELICLGLFSIIESVLTHNPKFNSDSIGHQIRTKVKLLSNRFDSKIDYSIYQSVPLDTLWKKLYDYRSRIAHGGKIDFGNEFQVLISAYDTQIFLNNFLKTLLRNALTEPQLYTDLKEC